MENEVVEIIENKNEKKKEEEKWSFYIIFHEPTGATYAGVSPDPIKRLRKHNGEISGGAKYTLSKGKGWQHLCLVHGFQSKIQSMQFEWALKHVPPRNVGGLQSRIKKLFSLFNKTHWTSKSPEASSVPLQLEWIKKDIDFLLNSENIDRKVPSYVSILI